MRILMLVLHPDIKGPIPKITPLIVSSLRLMGCHVVTAPWGRHGDAESLTAKLFGRAVDIAHIRRTLSSETLDVMVITTGHDWMSLLRDIPLLLVTRRAIKCIVLQLHGSNSDRLASPDSRVFKLASNWRVRMSDATMVLSSEEQRQWEGFYPRGRFHVVSNPFLPTRTSTSATAKLHWGLTEDMPVLLFVGRLIEAKGIFDLLKAVPRVLETIQCHVLVVGDGAQAAKVRECIAHLGLSDHVSLTGYLQGEELSSAYRAADVLVLPTFHAEGFPHAILEAMDVGLPIVTTCTRGIADHLQAGKHAMFVPPHDWTALSDALIHLLGDPALRMQMSRANREEVREFTPEIVGRRYLDVLEEVVSISGSRKNRSAAAEGPAAAN